ncbi:MAG: STAS domain-containing protein [Leptospiraceae bacterium]|nr:STAS domain-containing protein [Leptospiraceae bacterium]MDW7975409.1 STAS domain-containing protein [Leptospiraceae bacterium]
MGNQTIQDILANRVAFLTLKGDLRNGNALSFKKSIFHLPENKDFLILDLTNLNSISGEGIKVFVESIKYFKKKNGTIVGIQPKEEVYLLLRFLQLLPYIKLVGSYEEAKEYIVSQLQTTKTQTFNIEEKHWDEIFQKIEDLKTNLTNAIAIQEETSNSPSNPKSQETNKQQEDHYVEVKILNEFTKRQEESIKQLEGLKENIHNIKDQLQKITQRLDKQESPNQQKELINHINSKIQEIKSYNEFHFREFQIQLNQLKENQKNFDETLTSIKNELQEVKQAIQSVKVEKVEKLESNVKTDLQKEFKELQKTNKEEPKVQGETPKTETPPKKEIKRIDGYIIIRCQNCGQLLRVYQEGKHLCPKCKSEFMVLPKGEVKFFEPL